MKPLYTLTGTVKIGAKRGKEFGYPTANVSLESHIPAGVYAAQVSIDSTIYNAATFIGAAVTFGDKEYKSESYILDFEQDIYGTEIVINLYKKLRDNANFANEHDLIEQMGKDVLMTRSFFDNVS
ncbi:MAG: riboflavin kinase [Candidatus Levybacteria bacterium]|nr:riboflavin kinase [Candidatus Levybacteria bacterium]